MTGSRCHLRRKDMTGRGADGGSGTDEESPNRVSRVPAEDSPPVSCRPDVSLYDQARKALSERCPFDSDEAVVSRVSTLPVGLADFLSRYSQHHSRKKHKKSHSDSGAKSSGHASGAQSSRASSNVWVDTEDYFRPVVLSDIENLVEQCSFGRLVTGSYLSIPNSQKIVDNSVSTAAVSGSFNNAKVVEGDSNSVVNVEEVKEDEEQFIEIDGMEADIKEQPEQQVTKPTSSPSIGSGGLEWLLSARNRVLLTSERPSKKRKLLGRDAGLERLCIVRPSEGQGSPVCHSCCLGDHGEELNQFLVCNSCKVVVHQKCYGVQFAPVGLWLCSWCNQKDSLKTGGSGSEVLQRPCLLCPKQGGALKPVSMNSIKSKNGGFVRFVHLFCSQWIPEVYIDDTRTMEPILNVEGIKETRKNLVCYLCKVKYGASVRCSHGTCRTSFHPMCAREAKHRMEIWGKIGCENVELRAFCSKHSEYEEADHSQQSEDHSVDVGCNSSASKQSTVTTLMNKQHQLKLGHSNGDKSILNVTTSDPSSEQVGNSEMLLEKNMLFTESNERFLSDGCDARLPVSTKTCQIASKWHNNSHESLDAVQVLKKLVDRGKAVVSEVALEIGISSDFLAATLANGGPSSTDLQSKIVKWLQNHAYLGTLPQNFKSGANHLGPSRARVDGSNGHDAVAAASYDNSNACPLTSVSPRKAKHKIRILKDDNVVCSATEASVQQNDNGIIIDEINVNSVFPSQELKEHGDSGAPLSNCGDSVYNDNDALEKVLPEHSSYQGLGSSMSLLSRPEADVAEDNFCENDQTDVDNNSLWSAVVNSNGGNPISVTDVVTESLPDMTGELASSFHIHPFIRKRLLQFKNDLLLKEGNNCHHYGHKEKCITNSEAPFQASIYSSDQDCNPHCSNNNFTSKTIELDQLGSARNMGILKLSPEDEVEGQIIYFQNKLLDCAVATKCYCDKLIFRLVRSLPLELDALRKQQWDSVLVNQYLCRLREVKKQGRKEKRHKEAQAVLAAATAAAAASSRMPSFRKDAHDEEVPQEALLKVHSPRGRNGPYSQLMPRAKETLSRLAVARPSLDKRSDSFQPPLLKDHPQVCDICRRSETLLNPVLVCSNCKVAVHLVCYRNVKDPTGPWYCEVCEEQLLSRSPSAPSVASWENSGLVTHCGLCGGTTGAFRKSTDGQWVHAFCAEWLLEMTYRKGHPSIIEGMETILKEKDVCCVCCRKVGACIKCNYGNCQTTFHPSCARNAGFHMHVKSGLGRLQHKAYCEKHSLEQREKAETQQHGAEELKSIKLIRVELERSRLLCERIIKREKLKKDLVLCSHDILASKRDSVAFSVLVRSPFFLPDVSSESATTSLRGHVDDKKSCSEAIQRSDDITMDTAISNKRRLIQPAEMDVDQKTDDSSTSQHLIIRRPADRMPFSGKQIPLIAGSTASRSLNDDSERISKSRKHSETFHKEVLMTSYQASVQNQRLPKGFAYVPVVCLPKEKPTGCKAGSHEPPEPDG